MAARELAPADLYVRLGHLIETMPDLTSGLDSDKHQWLARAYALLDQTDDITDKAAFKVAVEMLGTPIGVEWTQPANKIAAIVHRALARAELAAPPEMRDAFIPAGGAFAAFAAIGRVLARGKTDVLIVDPYMSAKALTDFAVLVKGAAQIRLLADAAKHCSDLFPAVAAWHKEHQAARPLELRLARAKILHDRLISLDRSEVWVLTQSLNAFAARSPATIVRVDGETATLKVDAFEDIWSGAKGV